MFDTAMIHGRFQPFHLGHFLYLKEALKISKLLYVGITNPDPSTVEPVVSDAHRHKLTDNPFPFYLRLLMIRQSILCDNSIKKRANDVIIIPFPVNRPELWKYYIPDSNVIQIMRILDPWDLEKQKLFKEKDFQVMNLGGGRNISGSEIRIDLQNGNNRWQEKVPEGTCRILKQWLNKQ